MDIVSVRGSGEMIQKADNTELATSEDRVSLADVLSPLSPVQQLACAMLAEYEMPATVLAACNKEFGVGSINLVWINRSSSTLTRPKHSSTAIDAIREHYREMTNEPIMDPAWRMKQRRRIVRDALKAGDYKEARETLADVEKLTGPSQPSQQPTGAVNVMVNIGDMSEARARVEAMKASSGGRAPILPAGTTQPMLESDTIDAEATNGE